MILQPRDQRLQFLMKSLIAMAFLAKVSLGAVLPLPQSLGYFIYQQGLHPYMNVAICAALGMPLFLLNFWVEQKHHLSAIYKVFVFLLLTILVVETCLQIYYVDPDDSAIMQLGAVGVACFMVIIYGLIIPSIMNVHEFVQFVQKWTGVLVLISLIVLPIGLGKEFKGGRYIGVFKHIPHMVTCATVAFVFSLGTLLNSKTKTQKVWNVVVILASFATIWATGTRSSAGAVVLAVVLTLALHKTKTTAGRIFKFSVVTFGILFTLFFGYQTVEFAHDVATGQQTIGSRGAQNGVEERWEEVERGTEIFLEHPWLGHGLLSKFSSGDQVDVSNYNSMKDPHNIFVSAGVVGGWPLLIMAGLSLLMMTVGCLKGLLSPDISQRQVSIYLICHIPILVIYHIHLSIGGMADRVYWLVFGFVAASLIRSPSSRRTDKIGNSSSELASEKLG